MFALPSERRPEWKLLYKDVKGQQGNEWWHSTDEVSKSVRVAVEVYRMKGEKKAYTV